MRFRFLIPRTFEFFKPSSTPPSSLLRVPHTARGGKKVRIPSRIPPSSFFVSRIVVNTRPPRRSTARCVFFLPPFFFFFLFAFNFNPRRERLLLPVVIAKDDRLAISRIAKVTLTFLADDETATENSSN